MNWVGVQNASAQAREGDFAAIDHEAANSRKPPRLQNISQAAQIVPLRGHYWQARDEVSNGRQRSIVVKIEVASLGEAHETLG